MRQLKWAKISKRRVHRIIRCFSLEMTAAQTAVQLHLNRKTVDRYYRLLREKIWQYQEENLKKLTGNIEIDETYFGPRFKGGKRGRGTPNKIPIIGLRKRQGIVYTQVIKNASKTEIEPIIAKLVERSKSCLYTDQWISYDGLVLSGYKHKRINHAQEFVKNHHHINGIESFWSYLKRKMRKHNGLPRHLFHLYLKEAEFRFNHRQVNIYKVLLKVVFS